MDNCDKYYTTVNHIPDRKKLLLQALCDCGMFPPKLNYTLNIIDIVSCFCRDLTYFHNHEFVWLFEDSILGFIITLPIHDMIREPSWRCRVQDIITLLKHLISPPLIWIICSIPSISFRIFVRTCMAKGYFFHRTYRWFSLDRCFNLEAFISSAFGFGVYYCICVRCSWNDMDNLFFTTWYICNSKSNTLIIGISWNSSFQSSYQIIWIFVYSYWMHSFQCLHYYFMNVIFDVIIAFY